MLMPGRSPAVLATEIWVAPAGAAAVSVVSPGVPPVMGRTDCSKEKPVITPSEACGSNCTKWVWMLTSRKTFSRSVASTPALDELRSLVRVTAMQSPTSDLMASGCAGMAPLRIAAMFWLRTKISPLGSDCGSMGFPLASRPLSV